MRAVPLVVAILACGACAGDASTGTTSTAKTYTGPYSAQVVESTVSTSLSGGGTFPCTNTYTMSGTVTLTIDDATGAMVGSAQIVGTQVETAFSSGASCQAKADLSTAWSPKLTGTSVDLHFDDTNVSTNSGYVVTSKTTFSGALASGVVTGALGFSVSGSGTLGTTSIVQSYTTTMNVTLR